MKILQIGSQGNDVKIIQSLLHRMGLYSGSPDGVFGEETQQAVRSFQSRKGLTADGTVGPKTWEKLEPYLLGYTDYTVTPGDSIYRIAQKFGTNPSLISAANPGKNPQNLQIGTVLTVPHPENVVLTDVGFTYGLLTSAIQGLKKRYPFLVAGTAGTSVLGRTLYTLRLGTGPRQVLYNASHHSLEWITTPVLMRFAENYLKAYTIGTQIGGYNPRELWNTATIWLIPMVNPDGVDLVINGLQPDNPYHDRLLRWNGGSSDFSSNWEANIRGVDLNHNYDAGWQQSKQAEAREGITGPGPTRYSGPYPVSEPETRAMVSFTKNHDIRLAMAYHSQGRVIYWNFRNLAPADAKTIAENLSRLSGYTLDQATGIASYAGYKDWFIQDFRRPGYTIEVGEGKNPLPVSQFPKIYSENLGMLLYAASVRSGN